MKIIFASLLLSVLVFSASAQIETNKPARFKTKVIRYDGKIGSGTSGSTINFAPESTYPGNGGADEVTTPGHESELRCTFVGRNGNKDVYHFVFTRMTKAGVSTKMTTVKDISFDGHPIVIFEDDLHTVIIESPTEKELNDARPKHKPKPHA